MAKKRDTLIADVQEFLEYSQVLELPEEYVEDQVAHLREELDEFFAATTHAERFDALLDLIYVAIGAGLRYKYPMYEGWKLVHKANMTRVPVRTKRTRFDMVKPRNWQEPALQQLLDEHWNCDAR